MVWTRPPLAWTVGVEPADPPPAIRFLSRLLDWPVADRPAPALTKPELSLSWPKLSVRPRATEAALFDTVKFWVASLAVSVRRPPTFEMLSAPLRAAFAFSLVTTLSTLSLEARPITCVEPLTVMLRVPPLDRLAGLISARGL